MSVNCSAGSAVWCSTKKAIDGTEFNVIGDSNLKCLAFNSTLRQLQRVHCDEKLFFACEVIFKKHPNWNYTSLIHTHWIVPLPRSYVSTGQHVSTSGKIVSKVLVGWLLRLFLQASNFKPDGTIKSKFINKYLKIYPSIYLRHMNT